MVKLQDLIKEEETFKLKKKDGGNIVVFKNKDNYEKALKSGEYIDPINKGDDSLGGKDDEKGATATAADFDIDKRLGKDSDGDGLDSFYSGDSGFPDMSGDDEDEDEDDDYIPNESSDWDEMEDRMYSADDFDGWLDDNAIQMNDEDDQEVMDLMSQWYDLDGDLSVLHPEDAEDEEEGEEIENQIAMVEDELETTKDAIRKIMMKYKNKAEKEREEKDERDSKPMSSEEGIKNDLDVLRKKIKARGDGNKQIRSGNAFRQLAQDVEDEYGEEAGIKSVEDLRYISYDVDSLGIEQTEEMLKRVLDNMEVELQRYNSDVFKSVPGRDPKEGLKKEYQTIKEQFNRIKRK
tara:strand:- start:1122 stop:2168 length:1047 start_codon:yes stop_codon:yes gene_type:complete